MKIQTNDTIIIKVHSDGFFIINQTTPGSVWINKPNLIIHTPNNKEEIHLEQAIKHWLQHT